MESPLRNSSRPSLERAIKNRPSLLEALVACRKHKAIVLIARLDRLARNVAFIASLMESGVEFVIVDMPHASKFTIHIPAAVAEPERELISRRTKAALAAAKARGVKLGGPDPFAALKKANAAKQYRPPARHVTDLMSSLRDAERSYAVIAAELNARDIRTPQGFRWYAATVRAILLKHQSVNARIDAMAHALYDDVAFEPNNASAHERNHEGVITFALRNSRRAAADRTMRPRESRSQVSQRLRDADPDRLWAGPVRRALWDLPVPVRELVPYRVVPVLETADASARMKQMRNFTPLRMQRGDQITSEEQLKV
jgi:DNA invertase Pin-like site-specific DNA recombinase